MMRFFPDGMFVLLFLSLLPCLACGQTGTLSIAISSMEGFARVDGRVLDLSRTATLTLPAGTYTVETWAPYFAVHRDAVIVQAGETTRYVKGLVDKSAEYRTYLDARSAYATRKLHRTIPDLTLTALYGTLAYVCLGRNVGKAERIYDRALVHREAHRISINPIAIAQNEVDYARLSGAYVDAQAARNQQLSIGIPVVTVATAALVYHLIRRSRDRPVRPTYQARNPFTAVGFSSTANGLGLAVNF